MTQLTRRRLLAALAAAPILTPAMRASAQEAGLITGNVCLVQRETTEGPFYVDPGLVRADITEGRLGVPMSLRMQVVDAGCRPIEGARVDVWHCDAEGLYSGVRAPNGNTTGETFLRGTQMTDASGVAAFRTIYPGWYRGRTPHIHYIVFLGGQSALTSQLFFPDCVSETVYGNAAAYAARGAADTPNGADGIARRAGEAAVANVGGSTAGLDAALVVGIA
ncbi:intradiol ring-cleavage dioxygenase [Anianabacter salinae]|uniref:intradiol ring-cleavage dioxygenase n=1 Tax=Anianabacter salinae TaxID=2851023 RepID=UPI00225DCE2F|nr:intradiol ring-cleavage dioxygenase [Anianabacter salinae]MBV0913034.1 intradiol ring-cleavage dioxygenase [Anianabacter salinae]